VEPAVLSMMRIPGDPDDLMSKMGGIDEVAQRKAREYGGISSTVCRTNDGILIVNLWADEEGRHKMGDDPEIRQALQDAAMPPPSAEGYEVIQHRTADGG
jgi:hypothetical protein